MDEPFLNGLGFSDDYPRTGAGAVGEELEPATETTETPSPTGETETADQLPFPANLVATGRLTEGYAEAIVAAGFTTEEEYELARVSYTDPNEESDPRIHDLAVRLGRMGTGV